MEVGMWERVQAVMMVVGGVGCAVCLVGLAAMPSHPVAGWRVFLWVVAGVGAAGFLAAVVGLGMYVVGPRRGRGG
jgi:hypothetical protein